MVSSAAVIKSIDLKSWTEHVINASDSYTPYPTGSNFWNSKPPNHNESQYSLPLHLTKPALVQVYNYGPNGSKVDIYDHLQKIGETGSSNLTAFDNNNIGRVYLSKGDHSLSLQPYYKDGNKEGSSSTHFVKIHVMPKSPTYFLKKREPVYNNADKDTPEYNAYVQWDYDSAPKHYHNGGDDSVPKHYHNDRDNSVRKSMDEHWWKWHKKGGWKMGRKKNKKVIYISTVHYSEPTPSATITVTSTLTMDYTSTIPEPPTPSPRERMVTETVMKAGPTETVQNPATTETISKAGPTETATVTIKGVTAATAEATVILPMMINTVTEYRDIQDISTDDRSVETNRAVTVTVKGNITTIPGLPVTISNSPVTVTMNGQITTISPEPVTVTNKPVTITNDPQTIVSTVNVDVTHYLFRQTVVKTIYQTDTALVTVAFTNHNSVLETIVGGTSTTTENVLVTVYHTRSSTITSTIAATPTPS
ncbi:hypothetical protein INT48_001227 [Thamnidium elegans]|uniref:Uncharacterized protein n=1 Tax=Thamnidium elegans TaxID=101142 RepID=A0A8H7SMM6_9FUNG|nr:hypothetical protein INT48_001227 [Thamnidium elegans]